MIVQAVLIPALSPDRDLVATGGTPAAALGPPIPASTSLLANLLFTGLLVFSSPGFAQTTQVEKPASSASAPASAKPQVTASTVKGVATRPSWTELNPMQQQTLKPLAASWNTLSEAQKRKWLEISRNYPSLPPADQATMHSRMSEWVALSPQQRAEARLNFAKTKELSKQLTPEERKAKWQTYQALSPEEKQKLAANSTTRPVGAALAVKPVAPQKLAAVPPHGNKPSVSPLNPPRDAAPDAASTPTGTTASH